MSFIQFLKEYTNHSKIALQQVLDNLDDSHIDYDKEKIEINVGNIIKNAKYSNLIIAIHPNSTDQSIKFGKNKKSGDYTIVVYTKKDLPKRKEIDSFIADNDSIYNGILTNMSNYFEKKQFSNNMETTYEKTKNVNTDDSFEAIYSDITKKVKDKLKEYKTLNTKIKNELETTNNMSKKHTLELALDKLKKDILGNSLSEFTKIIYSGIDNETIKDLDQSFKAKLSSRVSSLYNNKVSNLN